MMFTLRARNPCGWVHQQECFRRGHPISNVVISVLPWSYQIEEKSQRLYTKITALIERTVLCLDPDNEMCVESRGSRNIQSMRRTTITRKVFIGGAKARRLSKAGYIYIYIYMPIAVLQGLVVARCRDVRQSKGRTTVSRYRHVRGGVIFAVMKCPFP